MPAKDYHIREKLLRSGKEEFLAHGFEQASLRTICKNAGLTTGAFYAVFSRKEDLFSALVDDMLREYYRMYGQVVRQALSNVKNNAGNELQAIEFICAHKDEFKLLFDCAAGTKYAGFREHLVEKIFMESYQECFDRYAGKKVSPSIVRIFVIMKFSQYMELIYGDYTMEQIRKLISQYAAFTEVGFLKLLELIKQEAP